MQQRRAPPQTTARRPDRRSANAHRQYQRCRRKAAYLTAPSHEREVALLAARGLSPCGPSKVGDQRAHGRVARGGACSAERKLDQQQKSVQHQERCQHAEPCPEEQESARRGDDAYRPEHNRDLIQRLGEVEVRVLPGGPVAPLLIGLRLLEEFRFTLAR